MRRMIYLIGTFNNVKESQMSLMSFDIQQQQEQKRLILLYCMVPVNIDQFEQTDKIEHEPENPFPKTFTFISDNKQFHFERILQSKLSNSYVIHLFSFSVENGTQCKFNRNFTYHTRTNKRIYVNEFAKKTLSRSINCFLTTQKFNST